MSDKRPLGLPLAMDRREFLRFGGAGLAGAALLASSATPLLAQTTSALQREARAASEKYKVPAELLLAMGYENTAWEMPPPETTPYEEGDLHGRGAYGIMQLLQNPSVNTLGEAARLTGLSETRLKTDRATNILGGAAVLARIKGRPAPGDLNAYYDAVAEYGGSQEYANAVYEVLRDGASLTISTGEKVTLSPQREADTRALRVARASGQYPGSTWWGASSSNYTNAGRPPTINKIIVHVAQGSYSGTLNWFRDPRAQASAHYTVGRGGAVGQSVNEADIAWHAGWWDYNKKSIGIEHEGYVSNPGYWFTDAMYRSSAKLSAYLCKKYRIPVDRAHIIGHNQVPGCSGAGGGVGCHTDPGSGWNWDKYMGYVRSYAGGNTVQVVDNTTAGRFSAGSGWSKNTWNSQRYGSSYRATQPGRASRDAEFKVKIPAKDSYAIYAWWPDDPAYNAQTVYLIRTAGGRWTRKTVNQRTNGGKWNLLGTYTLDRGDNSWVRVSRRSSARGYIIADAVKIVRK